MSAPTVETLDMRERRLAVLLADSAPRTDRHAQTSCDGCGWYHGAWQYLRVLGLVSSPAWHRGFYDSALRGAFRAATPGRPRVLISGTADFSMVEQVWHSMTTAIDLTVIDRCQTPLDACEWYKKLLNRHLDVAKVDMLAAKLEPQSFDVITTDAFLTRFSSKQTVDIIAAWHSLLDRRGRVVTTVRLHGGDDVRADPEGDIRRFTARARGRLPRWPVRPHPDPDWLAAAAEAYARRMQSSDVGDENAVIRAFTDNGFEILSREMASVEGELFPVSYLRIEARRLP